MSGGGGELRGRDAQDVVCQLSGSGKLICGQLTVTLHVCSPGAVETVPDVFFGPPRYALFKRRLIFASYDEFLFLVLVFLLTTDPLLSSSAADITPPRGLLINQSRHP